MKKITYQNGEIWQVKLYPTRGSEQDGIRPCLIVSPNSINNSLESIIVLPMTRSLKSWPTRILISFKNQNGQACIEHIRSISKTRFLKKLGSVSKEEVFNVRKHLQATFSH